MFTESSQQASRTLNAFVGNVCGGRVGEESVMDEKRGSVASFILKSAVYSHGKPDRKAPYFGGCHLLASVDPYPQCESLQKSNVTTVQCLVQKRVHTFLAVDRAWPDHFLRTPVCSESYKRRERPKAPPKKQRGPLHQIKEFFPLWWIQPWAPRLLSLVPWSCACELRYQPMTGANCYGPRIELESFS